MDGDADSIRKNEDECILGTYGRGATPVFTHGLGCKMWDTEGKEYLDFTAGIAVNCLGHSDPAWVVRIWGGRMTNGSWELLYIFYWIYFKRHPSPPFL